MFSYTTTVRIHDADPAGVLFFARYLVLAHDAYEAFLESCGFGAGRIFRDEAFVIPVVHAEADYRTPLWVGDHATIKLEIEELRRRSFTVAYEICGPSGVLACAVRTTHVVVSTETKRAVPLPDKLRAVLETCRAADANSTRGGEDEQR